MEKFPSWGPWLKNAPLLGFRLPPVFAPTPECRRSSLTSNITTQMGLHTSGYNLLKRPLGIPWEKTAMVPGSRRGLQSPKFAHTLRFGCIHLSPSVPSRHSRVLVPQ